MQLLPVDDPHPCKKMARLDQDGRTLKQWKKAKANLQVQTHLDRHKGKMTSQLRWKMTSQRRGGCRKRQPRIADDSSTERRVEV